MVEEMHIGENEPFFLTSTDAQMKWALSKGCPKDFWDQK